MNGFTHVFIMGFLGAAPERLVAKNGQDYVRLSVSTHRAWKNQDGVLEKRTAWHRVTVFGKLAELCKNNLHSGSPLALEGYLSRYEYEREDGTEAHGTGVVASQVHFLPDRKRAAGAAPVLTEESQFELTGLSLPHREFDAENTALM